MIWWTLILIAVGVWLLLIHAEWSYHRARDVDRAVWRRYANHPDNHLEDDIT